MKDIPSAYIKNILDQTTTATIGTCGITSILKNVSRDLTEKVLKWIIIQHGWDEMNTIDLDLK